VQVALDLPASLVRCRDDAAARRRELGLAFRVGNCGREEVSERATSLVTAEKSSAGGTPCATSVATRRSAACSPTRRCSASRAWAFAIAVAISSVKWRRRDSVSVAFQLLARAERERDEAASFADQPFEGAIGSAGSTSVS
jgi:hypothetical protein